MRFRGALSFATDGDATAALELLRAAECVVSDRELVRPVTPDD